MSPQESTAYAFNRTRRLYLARELCIAGTHWSRFCGLMGKTAAKFRAGQGLWIVPSRGVHTLAMRFPIDVVYLDKNKIVLYMKENLKPWRVAPINLQTTSVLELPASVLGATGTAVGDEIEISLGSQKDAPR